MRENMECFLGQIYNNFLFALLVTVEQRKVHKPASLPFLSLGQYGCSNPFEELLIMQSVWHCPSRVIERDQLGRENLPERSDLLKDQPPTL